MLFALKGHPSRAEIDAFTEYLRGGMEPGAATPGSEPLFAALRKGDWDTAAAMIAATPALVNAEDEDGVTPVFYVFPRSPL